MDAIAWLKNLRLVELIIFTYGIIRTLTGF